MYSGVQAHTSPFSNENIGSKNIRNWTENFLYLKFIYA